MKLKRKKEIGKKPVCRGSAVRKHRYTISVCSSCDRVKIKDLWKHPTGTVKKSIATLCQKNNLVPVCKAVECPDYPDCKSKKISTKKRSAKKKVVEKKKTTPRVKTKK